MREKKALTKQELLEELHEFLDELRKDIASFPKKDVALIQCLFIESAEHYEKHGETNDADFITMYNKVMEGKGTAEEIKEVKAMREQIKDFDYKYLRCQKYYETKLILMTYQKGYKLEDVFNAVANNGDVDKMRKDNSGIPN